MERRMDVEKALRFARARRPGAWRTWPGLAGLALGVAAWAFLAGEVMIPLGGALARLRAAETAARRAPEPAAVAADPCGEDRPPARRQARGGQARRDGGRAEPAAEDHSG
jgi:hypothetical protein